MIIAPLEHEEQKRWLALAEEEHLDTRELRRALSPEESPKQIRYPSEMAGILREIREKVLSLCGKAFRPCVSDYEEIAVLAEKGLRLLGEEA